MYETSKLKEAWYFYSRMVSEKAPRNNFHYDLSAFLSAARSVLQYALEEAKTKSGGQQWYDNHMKSSKVLTFFKDKRDINLHTQPVQVNRHIAIHVTEVIRISESIHIKKFDQTGRLIDEYSSEPSEAPPAPEIPTEVTHRFTFPDWSGTEDVEELCSLYFNELQRIVDDGQKNGFLTNVPEV